MYQGKFNKKKTEPFNEPQFPDLGVLDEDLMDDEWLKKELGIEPTVAPWEEEGQEDPWKLTAQAERPEPQQVPPQMQPDPWQVPPQRNMDPRQMPPQMNRDPRQVPPRMNRNPGQMPPQMSRDPRQMPPQMQGMGQIPPMMELPPEKPRKSRTGGLVFYTIFFACIFGIYLFAYGLLGDLQDWLVKYEAAQPTRKCQEVFAQYFETPDWGQLYDLAGVQGTEYEGKDAFIAYMDQRVSGREITYLETSAGLSKDKKYIVRADNEKIASFTLTDKNQAVEVTDIPDWELGKIELFYQGNSTYYIETLAGSTTTVNGKPLDETAVIRVATTKVGDYLPEGVTVPAKQTQQITGLMAVPQVEVTDAEGKPVTVTYDEASRTFTADMSNAGGVVGEDLKERALEGLKTYAIYMSQKSGGDTKLAEYFERGTELYKTLSSMERMWNQSYAGYSLTDESVTDAVRYSEDVFSARVSVTLHLERKDGTEKVTVIDRTMFLHKVGSKWKCYDMTAVDVNEPVEKVRLTFRTEEEILKSELVDTAAAVIECPMVSAPEGKTFGGWMKEEIQENGDRLMRVMFTPDETGNVPMPQDLEPMTLYPLFE